MGRETVAAGTVAETAAAAAAAGFIGWSPDPDRTIYKVTSANKRGPVETAAASGRLPQWFR